MQITNTLASIANYTATSVKSGFSCGASLACRTARCAANFFSGSVSFTLKAAARHPKILVALTVLAGAAAVALVARKRFNICILDKISGYCPFKAKKVEEEVKEEKVEKVAIAEEPVAKEEVEAISESDDETDTEVEDSPRVSRASSPAPAVAAAEA